VSGKYIDIGSRTPDRVVFRQQLPTTPTGKVLRRELVNELQVVNAGEAQ
jgi:acyl-coenzyme A synthetase/AMP-(fatty) acid ligase